MNCMCEKETDYITLHSSSWCFCPKTLSISDLKHENITRKVQESCKYIIITNYQIGKNSFFSVLMTHGLSCSLNRWVFSLFVGFLLSWCPPLRNQDRKQMGRRWAVAAHPSQWGSSRAEWTGLGVRFHHVLDVGMALGRKNWCNWIRKLETVDVFSQSISYRSSILRGFLVRTKIKKVSVQDVLNILHIPVRVMYLTLRIMSSSNRWIGSLVPGCLKYNLRLWHRMAQYQDVLTII